MKHIVVCIPFAREFVYTQFFISWSAMMNYAKNKYDLSLLVIFGPYIDTNRDLLISNTTELNPDYILFLDDDQTYPDYTPQTLMNWVDSGKMVVGGVTSRKQTRTPMIWDYNDGSVGGVKFWDSLNGEAGLVKVSGLGLGGVMIHPDVFKRIEYPFFKINTPTYQRHGEDMTFYGKCKDAGIDVWADLDLQYGHMVMKEACIGDSPR